MKSKAYFDAKTTDHAALCAALGATEGDTHGVLLDMKVTRSTGENFYVTSGPTSRVVVHAARMVAKGFCPTAILPAGPKKRRDALGAVLLCDL